MTSHVILTTLTLESTRHTMALADAFLVEAGVGHIIGKSDWRSQLSAGKDHGS